MPMGLGMPALEALMSSQSSVERGYFTLSFRWPTFWGQHIGHHGRSQVIAKGIVTLRYLYLSFVWW